MNFAIFQLPTLPLKEEKLSTYIKAIKKGSVVVLGEYVLNFFFHDLKNSPKELLNKIAQSKLTQLSKLAKKYDLTIVAPVVCGDEKKIYKKIAIIDGEKTHYYMQQRLISFSHWDEENFFANPKSKNFKLPYIFEKDGLKIATLFGFELHFDEIWLKLKQADVDVVILCTASTFDSNNRWRDLCKARAFINSCMVVRANRIGEYIEDGFKWKFYGDSFVALPNGKIEDNLGEKEEILCVEIQKEEIDKFVKEWNFR
ncbi:carbon-nitrogen hydrolase family protein [Helicobacter cappadocius]|uniref:Carbon-nitrogen hydrolase family protein n=1 Tax=Helicobacter cappadocius TaxID=3063998 RepID=A0AA90T9E4_9HELI|nr:MULTISPECIES: carbon-nitrogen hydrolase family protein [unclassified Helicobacter]MDO7253097.1 carbon-nitrogen hydrolase family protein [Helicobacter sp. faydin-H75]MDP2538777.1 carbon-nitrogen hydrolase family protein [Helicobacter sp. faydin-H76]